jgi:hypothetical protein
MTHAYQFGKQLGAQIKAAAGVPAPTQQPIAQQPPVFDAKHGRQALQQYYPKQYKPEMTDRQVYDEVIRRGTIKPGPVVMASRGVKQLPARVNPFQQAMRTRYSNTAPVFGADVPPAPPAQPPAQNYDPNDPTTW